MTALLLTALLACGAQADDAKPAPVPAADPAKVQAGLKKADLADGTEDKTVHKCAGCALGMGGSATHAIDKDGYTLHMCSAMCKASYEKNLDANLAGLAD
jgi:hypothetical protein